MSLVAWVVVHGALASFLPERLSAQEAFAPPNAYPVERYKEGWRKNPFALKTAPVPPEEVSFARDLVIAGYFGAEDNASVVIVNTKTRERTLLKKGDCASGGLILNSVTFASSRKETMAEVTLNGVTAVLRYDDYRIKQLTAEKKSRGTTGKPAGSSTESLPPDADPIASVPKDQGSGYPYTYGDPGDAGKVADMDIGPAQGRRRLFTAQKPVGLLK